MPESAALSDAASAILASPAALVLAAVFGAIWGSFFNVCIARVPEGQSVVRPASRCGSCGAPVRPRDNIPILSYFLLRGRCRSCGAPFSARYPLVELLSALLAAAIWWRVVASDPTGVLAIRLARFVYYFAFTGVLVVLSFIDLATLLLPDIITLPAIVVFFLGGFGVHEAGWIARLVGVGAGYLFVRLIADFYYYVLKREGLGLGDGKLLALIGAALGAKALPFVVFAGAFTGSIIGIGLVIATRHRAGGRSVRDLQLPFGPFLALGALAYVFGGRELLTLAGGAWL
jgi:leader peptidase (prepilin peptidase)/N-methyltransferase